jgi:hypothetical protein
VAVTFVGTKGVPSIVAAKFAFDADVELPEVAIPPDGVVGELDPAHATTPAARKRSRNLCGICDRPRPIIEMIHAAARL